MYIGIRNRSITYTCIISLNILLMYNAHVYVQNHVSIYMCTFHNNIIVIICPCSEIYNISV